MDRSFLEKYASPDSFDPSGGNVLDLETDDLGAYGYLRGIRDRCAMLALKKVTGNCLAISYSFIDRIELDLRCGIALTAGGKTIRIKGRNLNGAVGTSLKLFESLTRHKVPWIREFEQGETIQAKEGACVIEAIEW